MNEDMEIELYKFIYLSSIDLISSCWYEDFKKTLFINTRKTEKNE